MGTLITGKDILKEGSRITGIGIVGLWLLILYPILIWFVLGTLSGHGFQDKVRRIQDKKNNSLTIPSVVRQADQLIEIRTRENSLKIQLEKIDTEIEQLNDNIILKEKEVNDLHKVFNQLGHQISTALERLELERKIKKSDTKNLQFVERVQPFLQKNESLNKIWVEYQKNDADLQNLVDELESWYRKKDQVYVKKQNVERRVKTTSDLGIKILEKDKAGDVITELEFMNNFLFRGFATMPSQLLILLLTLSMGALGSLLYITQDYFYSDKERSFSWYFFRPFLGMVTAFSIFILAKAGQITISDVTVSEGILENLNPFFISFLAIISGLLSEQAIEKIRRSALPFFQPNAESTDEEKRWAVGLRSAMKAQNRSAKDLVPYVDVPLEKIEEWISEKSPVSDEIQRIVASWLNIPVRQIFTDLPPAQNKSKEEQ